MERIIEELSYELWVAISQLDKTFDWQLNWFYHKKVAELWKMLDIAIELNKKEILLNK